MQGTGIVPLQEFCGVIEPEGRIIVLNIVCGQEFVYFFQLDNTGSVEVRRMAQNGCLPERGYRYRALSIQNPWEGDLDVA